MRQERSESSREQRRALYKSDQANLQLGKAGGWQFHSTNTLHNLQQFSQFLQNLLSTRGCRHLHRGGNHCSTGETCCGHLLFAGSSSCFLFEGMNVNNENGR